MNTRAESIEYLVPVFPREGAAPARAAAASAPASGPAAVSQAFAGKTIAFLDNGWKSFGSMARWMGQALRERHGAADVRHHFIPSAAQMPADIFDGVVAQCDYAIVGMAN